jgi:hypothetical protein
MQSSRLINILKGRLSQSLETLHVYATCTYAPTGLVKKDISYLKSILEELLHVIKCNDKFYYDSAGRMHRLAGPAIEWSNGGTEWWWHGERHRLNGPAIERSDGYKEWWIKDKRYTESSFHRYLSELVP